MYLDVLRDYIKTERPTREDAQERIDYGVAAGKITAEEAAGLTVLLSSSSAAMKTEDALAAVSMRLAALEAAGRDESLPAGVIPWVPPTGPHDAPNTGDRRYHAGEIWESLIDGNTTMPGSDPRWWKEVREG